MQAGTFHSKEAAQAHAINVFNAYFAIHQISDLLTPPLTFVRFTRKEFAQLLAMPDGTTVTHANLQHSGIPQDLMGAKYELGVMIEKGGTNTPIKKVPPIVDYQKIVLLEQLQLKHSLNVSEPLEHENLLLHNKGGLYKSFYEKYLNVMHLSSKEIKTMEYYVRVLKIITRISRKQ